MHNNILAEMGVYLSVLNYIIKTSVYNISRANAKLIVRNKIINDV